MIFLDEKPRFTFANFLYLFIQGPPLTHSAMVRDFLLEVSVAAIVVILAQDWIFSTSITVLVGPGCQRSWRSCCGSKRELSLNHEIGGELALTGRERQGSTSTTLFHITEQSKEFYKLGPHFPSRYLKKWNWAGAQAIMSFQIPAWNLQWYQSMVFITFAVSWLSYFRISLSQCLTQYFAA